jgi:hypothetical protein
MILELKFQPFSTEEDLIIESPQTVRVSVLASRESPEAGSLSWYLSALPDLIFCDVSPRFDPASDRDRPCVRYLSSSKSFSLYFVAEFHDREVTSIVLPLESVTEVTDFHEIPWFNK